jgi:hypothetical protein
MDYAYNPNRNYRYLQPHPSYRKNVIKSPSQANRKGEEDSLSRSIVNDYSDSHYNSGIPTKPVGTNNPK